MVGEGTATNLFNGASGSLVTLSQDSGVSWTTASPPSSTFSTSSSMLIGPATGYATGTLSALLPGLTLKAMNPITGQFPAPPIYYNATAQAANINAVTMFTAPASGQNYYDVKAYFACTQAATSSSGAMGQYISYTDPDTNASQTVGLSGTAANCTTATAVSQTTAPIHVKASTTVTMTTYGYSSTGATPMQYAVHMIFVPLE